MKKSCFCLLVVLGFAPFLPACNKIITTPSSPVSVPTPTPTLVPGCGISIVGQTGYPIPVSTPTLVATPVLLVPVVAAGTPIGTPVVAPASGVISSLSQWTAAYPTTAPPVNFSQQMIVPVSVIIGGCGGLSSVTNVCWTSDQITISVAFDEPPPSAPTCNVASIPGTELVAVPQCGLPVVVETSFYYGL